MLALDNAYWGQEKLVFSLDIGSSNSSVAVGHFQPGRVPIVRSVNRYPASQSNHSRVPSVILYDMNDRPRAFGFETRRADVVRAAREQGWAQIQAFKAQMVPTDPATNVSGLESSKSSSITGGLASVRIKAHKIAPPAPNRLRRTASISEAPTISSPVKNPPLHIQKSIASLRGDPSGPRARPPAAGPPVEGLTVSFPSRPATPLDPRERVKGVNSAPSSPAMVSQKKNGQYVGPLLKVIYADLIAHLLACARAWFEEIESPATFTRLWPSAVFVLAHPADYGPQEIELLRSACELAKILPSDFAPGRLVFIKEPVAAMHFLRRHTEPAAASHHYWAAPGNAVVVVDASETHTTINGFHILDAPGQMGQMQLRPFQSPARLPVGAVTISRAVEAGLRSRLAKSKFKAPKHLRRAMRDFERERDKWAGPKVDLLLKLSEAGGNDAGRGVRDGVLTLTGFEIEEAFTAAVERIAVKALAVAARAGAKHVLLSGGLCEHSFIQLRLEQILRPLGAAIVVPDIPAHTAVSEGALRFYIAETVVPRRTRFELGVSSAVDWSTNWQRGSQRPVFTSVTGARYIQGKWAPFVAKGVVLTGASEPVVKPYSIRNVLSSRDPFFSVELFAHDPDPSPRAEGWMTTLLGAQYPNFHSLGKVTADLSSLIALEVASGRVRGGEEQEDKRWVQLQVKLMVYMGPQGLEACVGWDENGVSKCAAPVAIADEYW